ncbi:hypothetical protein K420107F6_18160 [Lactonifactor longoviformis]
MGFTFAPMSDIEGREPGEFRMLSGDGLINKAIDNLVSFKLFL